MRQQSGEGGGRRKSDLLLARMSYDIRTSMSSIVGLSHLCLRTDLSDRQREYLEKIQDSAVTLVGILNDILDFSRIESGRVELLAGPFRMADLLRKIADTLGPRAEKKGLEVLFRVAPDVPEHLEGDSYRLCQALANLADNAVRYAHKGEIIINVETLERQDTSYHLHFSVQDTGLGMTKEQMDHIARFFSLPQKDLFPEAHPDAGLGLAIAHMLVRLMGGNIWMESDAEHGNAFHISLWIKAGAVLGPYTVPTDVLRRLHVLVVDDNASARIILTEALMSFGFRVESAETGTEALNMLQEACGRNDPFTLVLLDWKMPGLDGVETAKQIREHSSINTLPQLLMVSAADMEDCRQQGVDAGIQGFLIKPVARSLLFDAIVRLFAKEKSEEEREASVVVPERGGDVTDSDGQEALKGARILLVEDNEINQQIAVELLQQAGSVVITANNGKEALDILQQQPFDAVLMDIQMPIMDGLEATRRARELSVPGIRSLPILAMTAHAMESDREKSLHAGMQEHLTKPIDPEQMYRVLSKWIHLSKSAALDIPPIGVATPGGFDDLPGLAVQDALKNLGGDEGLYIKLLKRFVESYEHTPQQVRDALAAGDRKLAVRLAHTVRGLAASLGASSLTSVAGDLERTLAAEKEHAAVLAQMRDVLRQTIESIRVFLKRVRA